MTMQKERPTRVDRRYGGAMQPDSKSDRPKAIAKAVAFITALALLAGLWTAFIDEVWPSSADAAPVCSEHNPCKHPEASKGKAKQFRQGKIGNTSSAQFRKMLSPATKRKLKKAYRLYRIDQQQNPRLGEGDRRKCCTLPNPEVWFRGLTERVKCATVGASKSYWGMACSGHTPEWYKKVNMAIQESARVTVKCGGAAVFGGLTAKGKKSIRKAFGVGVRGGWGVAAFGGACMWNEYFDDVWPWPKDK